MNGWIDAFLSFEGIYRYLARIHMLPFQCLFNCDTSKFLDEDCCNLNSQGVPLVQLWTQGTYIINWQITLEGKQKYGCYYARQKHLPCFKPWLM